MRELRGVFVLALLAGGLPPTAWGAPYWVAYEGNVFPEEDGWERRVIDDSGQEPPGAERSLLEGVFTIDSRRNPNMTDSYRVSRSLNPSAGETFVADWRVGVSELTNPFGSTDVRLSIAPDQMGILSFRFFEDGVSSPTDGWTIPLTPGVIHAYELVSYDMQSYSLSIDGVFAVEGTWELNSSNQSFVVFGDTARGGAFAQ